MGAEEKKQRQLILRIGKKYRFEEAHALFVEEAALKLFDALQPLHRLGRCEKVLLSHAALLHDIGAFINPLKHHKHTRYLIDTDRKLDEYPARQRLLLSLIASNHRKKICRQTYELPEADRAIALRLSALLRIADALHYSRENVKIHTIDFDEKTVTLASDADCIPDEVHRRLSAKKPLFVDLYGMDIRIT